MSFSELIPSLRALPRVDKLLAIQFLAAELARDESPLDLLQQGVSYPIWSPVDAHEGAETLLRLLEREQRGTS